MGLTLHEPGVALTDLAVGLEAGAFAILVTRTPASEAGAAPRARAVKPWFTLFFASTSIAALAGALLHGLSPNRSSNLRRRLWRLSLGSIGIAALSAWTVASVIALPGPLGKRVRRGAVLVHGAYIVGLTRTNPPYVVAVMAYLPGAVAFAAALARVVDDDRTRSPARSGLAGLALTFVAAVAQTRRIAIHPTLLDHNATYHLIQATSIFLLFRAARGFVTEPRAQDSRGQPTGRR